LQTALKHSFLFSVQDISVGQLLLGATVLGIPLSIPAFIVNWTMTYQPDQTWRRDTATLGIPSVGGSYTLRRIVDGVGGRARWFDDWVKARGGNGFTYPLKL
jgi:hypothetical protein